MVRSSRPELIKDNPAAPQIYVGPRRRRALAAQGVLEESAPTVEQESKAAEEHMSPASAPKKTMRKKIAAVVAEAITKGGRTKRGAR
ncbi:MAG: hypothetical protein U0172_11725 [Nitrospiraceae bacterium]